MKVIGKIRLAPQVPAWCDSVNNLYLNREHMERKVLDSHDFNSIQSGVRAGLIYFIPVVPDVQPEVKEPVVVEIQPVLQPVQIEEEKPKRKPRKKKEVIEEQPEIKPEGDEE